MVFNFREFEKGMTDSLKNSQLISKYNSVSEFESLDQEVIKRFFEVPSLIFFDENGLYFIDGEDKTYCLKVKTSISDRGEWLSSKLPPLTLDIDQAGNVRKADEVEAAYTCVVIANVLDDNNFFSFNYNSSQFISFHCQKSNEMETLQLKSCLHSASYDTRRLWK